MVRYSLIKKVLFWLFVGVLLLVSFLPTASLSSSGGDTPHNLLRWDYLFHFWAFLFLVVFYCLTHPSFYHLTFQFKLSVMILGVVLAVVAEWGQYYIPSRSFNPLDLGFNFLGLSLGYLLVWLWRRKQLNKYFTHQLICR